MRHIHLSLALIQYVENELLFLESCVYVRERERERERDREGVGWGRVSV